MDKTKANYEYVDVFIGVRTLYGADGRKIGRNAYGRISKATSDFIGVNKDFIKTGKDGDDVVIKKGSAKGARYKKVIRGSRGTTYKLVYPVTNPAKGAPKTKIVSIGCPAGTPGTSFLNFVKRAISKKPDSIIYPSGKSHRFAAAATR
jgi:hypothetical protein